MTIVKTYNTRDNFLQGGQTQLFSRLNLASLQGNFTRDWGGFFIMNKRCNKCLLELSIDNFSRKKSEKDGRQRQCKQCAKKMQKAWRKNNPEKSKKSIKTWAQKNKEHRNRYAKERRTKNPQWLLLNRLRKRLSDALKENAKADSTMSLLGCSLEQFKLHIESQFTQGMSWDKLGFYGIHIDHIVPCSKFDLSDPDQQRQCFHYTNLQPLWWKDNLKKGSKTT